MKYCETELSELHRGYMRYPVREVNGKLYIFDQLLPFLRAYTYVYCSEDLVQYMDKKMIVNPLNDIPVFCKGMEYERLVKIGVRVNNVSELRSAYSVWIQDENFFDSYELSYQLYCIFQNGRKILESVTYTDISRDARLLAEKKITENLDTVLNLPLARNLPEPLRTVVYDQAYTDSGMLFIENDDEFTKNWNEKKLLDLSSQIDIYELNAYIEMPKDPKDAFQIEKGKPAITAYCGLATKFNFV